MSSPFKEHLAANNRSYPMKEHEKYETKQQSEEVHEQHRQKEMWATIILLFSFQKSPYSFLLYFFNYMDFGKHFLVLKRSSRLDLEETRKPIRNVKDVMVVFCPATVCFSHKAVLEVLQNYLLYRQLPECQDSFYLFCLIILQQYCCNKNNDTLHQSTDDNSHHL